MYNEIFSLKDKVAIITGVPGGIGSAIAEKFAASGADIVGVCIPEMADNDLSETVNGYGREYLQVELSVTEPGAADTIIKCAVEKFGHVDILVTCAAVTARGFALDVTEETWQNVLDINLTSCFFLCRRFAKQIISQQSGGKIINIASMVSYHGSTFVIPYTASKAAVKLISQDMCNEWAQYGINVNCVAPGFIETPLTAAMRADPERSKAMMSRIPLKRWGKPEDVAHTAVFLASKASDYLTGITIPVDGGYLAN